MLSGIPAFPIVAGTKLIIFDLDGTLVPFMKENLLPGVDLFFRMAPPGIKFAIASNQGGVGMRYHLLQKGRTQEAAKYPSIEDVALRLALVTLKIPAKLEVVEVCYRYADKNGDVYPAPTKTHKDKRWYLIYRKPRPGMLKDIMDGCWVKPSQTMMVGDRPEDEGAAQACGCHFEWAGVFFMR